MSVEFALGPEVEQGHVIRLVHLHLTANGIGQEFEGTFYAKGAIPKIPGTGHSIALHLCIEMFTVTTNYGATI